MLSEMLQLNIYAFILVFARLGTAFMLMPGIGNSQFPARMRLGLGLATTFVLTPFLSDKLPPMPAEIPNLFALIAGEVMAGAILGTIPMILMSVTEVAGSVISLTSGLASALTYDPVVQQQTGIASSFLSAAALVLIFITDVHHLFIQAIVDSYSLFVPGGAPDAGDTVNLVARNIADTFRVGVQISAPFILVGFAYSLGMGLLTRLAPQVPVFFIGQPLQLIISMILFMITISSMMLTALNYFGAGLRPFLLTQ